MIIKQVASTLASLDMKDDDREICEETIHLARRTQIKQDSFITR